MTADAQNHKCVTISSIVVYEVYISYTVVYKVYISSNVLLRRSMSLMYEDQVRVYCFLLCKHPHSLHYLTTFFIFFDRLYYNTLPLLWWARMR